MHPSEWIQVGIGLATLTAAYFAYRSAHATQATSEAQVFIHLMNEYASEEMLSALTLLKSAMSAWHYDPSVGDVGALDTRWELILNATNGGDIDRARHAVSHFYRKASRIIDEGLLSGGLRDEIVLLSGRYIMYDAVLPLDRVKARELGTETEAVPWFERFTRLFPDDRRARLPR